MQDETLAKKYERLTLEMQAYELRKAKQILIERVEQHDTLFFDFEKMSCTKD